MPLSSPDPPGAKKMIFASLGGICSLFTRILNLDFHWVFPWDGFHQVCIIIELNNWCFCWFCYHLTLHLFCFNRTMQSVNGKWHLWEEVPSAQNLLRHKKLHNDLTKPCDMCKGGYDVKEWTIIRGIQLCAKTPTATAAAEKPTFDCVPCNKSLPKIHFLFVLSICLPPRLLSSLSSLIVIPYPFDPGR